MVYISTAIRNGPMVTATAGCILKTWMRRRFCLASLAAATCAPWKWQNPHQRRCAPVFRPSGLGRHKLYIYRLIPSWRLIRNPANGYFQHFPTCWTCALLAEFEGENVEFCLVCGGNLQSLGNTFPELYVTGCANF